jgi:hypothetical protein
VGARGHTVDRPPIRFYLWTTLKLSAASGHVCLVGMIPHYVRTVQFDVLHPLLTNTKEHGQDPLSLVGVNTSFNAMPSFVVLLACILCAPTHRLHLTSFSCGCPPPQWYAPASALKCKECTGPPTFYSRACVVRQPPEPACPLQPTTCSPSPAARPLLPTT